MINIRDLNDKHIDILVIYKIFIIRQQKKN